MATNLDIQKMYIAYFGRPADVSGLSYWTNQITNANGDASAVINAFSASAEYADNYAGKSNEFIVNSLYNNLFGRDAEVDGLTYWSGKLLDGTFSVGNVAWAIMSGAQNEDVTALGNKATAAQTFTNSMNTTTEILGYSGTAAAAAAKAWLVTVTDTQASLDAAVASVDTAVSNTVAAGSASQGQTFTLTTGVDTSGVLVGSKGTTSTDGNDTFNALIDNNSSTPTNVDTLTPLDNIDGGTGKDILNISIVKNGAAGTAAFTALPSATLSNIETINIQSAVVVGTTTAAAALDTTTIAGLEKLNITKSAGAFVKAAATTDVSVAGTTGAIEVYNAKDVTVTDATAGKDITIGDNSATTGSPAGKITVTDTDNTYATAVTNDILITGGTDVTVTTTATAKATTGVTGGNVTIGHATNGQASGNVVVTQNTNSDGSAAITAGDVTIIGGKTVSITTNSTLTSTKTADSNAITAGTQTVTAGNTTTDVTITQNSTATAFAGSAATIAAKTETAVVTFGKLNAGEAVFVSEGAADAADLGFVASKDLTAEQVAAAFANLTNADTQASGGVTTNGYFVGTLDAGWTAGAVSGKTVTFTATTAGLKTDLAVQSNDDSTVASAPAVATDSAAFSISVTQGAAASADATAANTIAATNGAVVVDDNATKSIENITVNGATTVTLGGATATKSLDSLKTVSLANVTGATVLNTQATALALTVNKVSSSIDLDKTTNAQKITDLTLNATGTASSITTLTAAAVKNLTVDAGAALTIGTNVIGTTANALETVTIKGAAAVNLATVTTSTNLKSFDASANTGGVTATINAATAASHADLKTFTFSGGNDVVTLSNITVDKKVDLGAGNDTITVAGSALAGTATIDGGTGTNTLKMTAANAATASAGTDFGGKISNFQTLHVTAAAATSSINLANLDAIKYVIVSDAAGTAAQEGTITFGGTESTGADDVLTTTITDAGGTTTFTTTVVAGSAATAATTVVSATSVATGTPSQTYTVTEAAGVVTITGSKSGTSFTTSTVLTTGTAGEITIGAYTPTATAATTEVLTLTSMEDNGTLELTNAGAGATVTMKLATGDTDTFNIVTKVSTEDLNFGTVTVAGVETININATDSSPLGTGAITNKSTLILTADAAKTVNVTGSSDVALTLTGSTKVTLIDGHTMTGALTATTAVSTAVATIKGGSGNDNLTATLTNDVLFGNDGADTLIVASGANLVSLNGGAGKDTYDLGVVTSSNGYATINGSAADLSGDVIKFTGQNIVDFTSAKIDLGTTAVFQDYANEAAKGTAADHKAAWFVWDNNTYVVQNNSTSASFDNGVDAIVKIAGVVTFTYNDAAAGILEIA